jgi:nucleotide-binding universal stress UspA family protein
MPPNIIISYDDTANDHDALALGQLFAEAGATVSLAYVRHSPPSESNRREEQEARELLERGAEYRTAPGAVQPGTSAQWLLNGGPAAVAVAPADLRSRSSIAVARIGVLAEGDEASETTARSLAGALGASVVPSDEDPIDLLVVASRAEAPAGRVTPSATAQYAIETADCPVLVVPRDTPVRFGARAVASA